MALYINWFKNESNILDVEWCKFILKIIMEDKSGGQKDE
jgi:hypothetical protein